MRIGNIRGKCSAPQRSVMGQVRSLSSGILCTGRPSIYVVRYIVYWQAIIELLNNIGIVEPASQHASYDIVVGLLL